MKKLLSLLAIILITATFMTGCGTKDRILYKENLSKYVDLGEYKNIKVDKSSEEFKKFYEDIIATDVSDNDLYVKKTEGTVADGDTVNIDYTGKKDGVAFDGGTDKGYDLVIGSNSFIDGFESGLIGKKIGDTVDLNLTFPADYSSADLAGKAVVFTVKINYVKTEEQRKPEDYYKEIDFKSLDKYIQDVEKRASESYLLDAVTKNSKIKDYPKDDIEILYTSYKAMMEKNISSQYGIDFATYLGYMNQTEEDFKTDTIKNQIKPIMDSQMVLYRILDKERLSLTDKDITAGINETLKKYNNDQITAETLKEFYGEYYFEYLAVSKKALDYIYSNAKISK